MAIRFNADELFEIADQIEKNGSSYYKSAAARFSDQKIGKLLSSLAEMENSHRVIFQALRTEIKEYEKKSASAGAPDKEQIAPYLRALADNRIFNVKTEPTKLLKGNETLDDIFKIAIGLEKDSIVFYLGMKETVPKNLGRDKIDGIIKEEMNHIIILNEAWQGMR